MIPSIKTELPGPKAQRFIEMSKQYEPNSMSDQVPAVWRSAEGAVDRECGRRDEDRERDRRDPWRRGLSGHGAGVADERLDTAIGGSGRPHVRHGLS